MQFWSNWQVKYIKYLNIAKDEETVFRDVTDLGLYL